MWHQFLDKEADREGDWTKMYTFRMRDHDISEFEETCGVYQRAEDEASRFMCENPVVMLKVRRIGKKETGGTNRFFTLNTYMLPNKLFLKKEKSFPREI